MASEQGCVVILEAVAEDIQVTWDPRAKWESQVYARVVEPRWYRHSGPGWVVSCQVTSELSVTDLLKEVVLAAEGCRTGEVESELVITSCLVVNQNALVCLEAEKRFLRRYRRKIETYSGPIMATVVGTKFPSQNLCLMVGRKICPKE